MAAEKSVIRPAGTYEAAFITGNFGNEPIHASHPSYRQLVAPRVVGGDPTRFPTRPPIGREKGKTTTTSFSGVCCVGRLGDSYTFFYFSHIFPLGIHHYITTCLPCVCVCRCKTSRSLHTLYLPHIFPLVHNTRQPTRPLTGVCFVPRRGRCHTVLTCLICTVHVTSNERLTKFVLFSANH